MSLSNDDYWTYDWVVLPCGCEVEYYGCIKITTPIVDKCMSGHRGIRLNEETRNTIFAV